MNLADDMLGSLRDALGSRPVPMVRALHLPPEPWNGSKDGEFGALELDDGSLGLSYLLLGDTLAALTRGGAAGALRGADPFELAARWAHGHGAEKALGFAAVNALTRHFFDRAGFAPPPATDSIGGLDPQPGEHVGMVGFFPPLVKQVTARGARLTVLELRASLAGEREDFRITLDPADLDGCDKVLCTSTVLLNDTLDDIVAHCRGARALAMIGPGAGCLPDPLFARGVTLIGGSWIEDREGFAAALATGAPWGGCARKFALAAAHYPGWRELKRRAEARR